MALLLPLCVTFGPSRRLLALVLVMAVCNLGVVLRWAGWYHAWPVWLLSGIACVGILTGVRRYYRATRGMRQLEFSASGAIHYTMPGGEAIPVALQRVSFWGHWLLLLELRLPSKRCCAVLLLGDNLPASQHRALRVLASAMLR